MGRPKLWSETILVRLPKGMKDRMAAALTENEDKSAFIRAAIDKEIARRAKAKRVGPPPRPSSG